MSFCLQAIFPAHASVLSFMVVMLPWRQCLYRCLAQCGTDCVEVTAKVLSSIQASSLSLAHPHPLPPYYYPSSSYSCQSLPDLTRIWPLKLSELRTSIQLAHCWELRLQSSLLQPSQCLWNSSLVSLRASASLPLAYNASVTGETCLRQSSSKKEPHPFTHFLVLLPV